MNRKLLCGVLLMGFALTLWTGCALRSGGARLRAPEGPVSPQAVALLEACRSRNVEVFSMKASGDLRMENHKGIRSAQIAITVVRPDKLRLTILGWTGFPIADMASDGSTLTLVDHTNRQHYREALHSGSLSPILDLPIQPEDAIAILCGAIPERDPKTLLLTESEETLLRRLTLFNDRRDPALQLWIDASQNVHQMVVFDGSGDEAYNVTIEGQASIDGVSMPSRLVFRKEEGVSLRIRLDRIWVNAGVSPDIFVLNP